MPDPAAKPSVSFSSQVLSREFHQFWGNFGEFLSAVGILAAMDMRESPTPLTGLMDVGQRSTKKIIFFVKWRSFPLFIVVCLFSSAVLWCFQGSTGGSWKLRGVHCEVMLVAQRGQGTWPVQSKQGLEQSRGDQKC